MGARKTASRSSPNPAKRGAEFCTVADAADALGVSVSTVWRWVDAGKLPAVRIGPRAIRIRRHDVAAAIRPVKDTPQTSMAHLHTDVAVATRPLTRDEKRQFAAAIEAMDKVRNEILLRRKGKLVPDSTALIRQAREDRSRRT